MYSYRDIWKVSFPIVLGLLAQNVIQITDTIFLGRVGEVEFGAAGLAGIYYIAFFMLGFGFSIGGQIMISRRNGEREYGQIGSIVIQGILFLQFFALALYFLSSFFQESLLSSLIKSPAVYTAASDYLEWRSFGFFFSFINVMFRAFYVGIARTSVLTLNAVVMAIVNIIGDYALIFGKLGCPELGIAGAGMASVLSELASVLFFVIYTYKRVNLKKYGFAKPKFNFDVIRRILNISVFTMVQYLVSMSTWFIFFLAIENHGERALAITNIVRSFYMVFFIPMNALATTANTLVGNTMGAGNLNTVIPLIKRIGFLNMIIVVAMGVVVAIAPQFWISLLASDKSISLVQEAVAPLLVIIAALPICSFSTVAFNAISGTGNTRMALILEMITMAAYVTSMFVIVIYYQSSVAVCWTVEYFYWGPLLILSYIYLKKGNWQAKEV
ncbi:MATE family efflux transporter [Dysgonomonas sp. 216]|uniref:MATE family efflux transporter n=1 Tax=Dysgonomonas sp. 216 TaxID=2302934 RepID=UPI0013D6FDC0|nr:MATE family efflux transporter [Dysgonomonas sp. 216]NDW19507.1 MATE family efflux transporter [Dysgonomonas sp. 216]